jgi:hypothetical protein
MKRLVSVSLFSLIVVGVLLSSAATSDAWSRGGGWHGGGGWHSGGPRVFIGFSPAYYWGSPYWYYPPPAYGYAPPVVVQEQPPVYVQQPPAAPAPPAPSASAPSYWYYCASAREYYPRVETCPETWVKVPPRQD